MNFVRFGCNKLAWTILTIFITPHAFSQYDVNFDKFNNTDISAAWRPQQVKREAHLPFRNLSKIELEDAIFNLIAENEIVFATEERAPIAFNIAQELISSVYTQYQNVFPTFMALKQIPDFFVTEDEIAANHAVINLDESEESTFGFLLLSRLMLESSEITNEEKTFIIAHEMAHLFLVHDYNSTFQIGYAEGEMSEEEKLLFKTWSILNRLTTILSPDETELQKISQEISDIERKIDVKNIRVYRSEDQADEIAALVMKSYSPQSLLLPGSTVLLKLALENDEQTSTCLSMINEGKIPDYGELRDDHRDGCFRFLNINLFARANDFYLNVK